VNFLINVTIVPLPARPPQTITEAKVLGQIRVECVNVAVQISQEISRLVNQEITR